MTQPNRVKIEVENLEDRITPAALGCYLGAKLSALHTTLHGKVSGLQSQISSQLAYVQSKIQSLSTHTGSTSSHTHTAICNALDAAYAKLVSIGAPQSVINKIVALQAKFGCVS